MRSGSALSSFDRLHDGFSDNVLRRSNRGQGGGFQRGPLQEGVSPEGRHRTGRRPLHQRPHLLDQPGSSLALKELERV